VRGETSVWQKAAKRQIKCTTTGMMKRLGTCAILIGLGFSVAACSRGGRSPNWDEQTISKVQPDPGYGQTGPGMTTRVNAVNGPNDSVY
jgi:hypothetical protein